MKFDLSDRNNQRFIPTSGQEPLRETLTSVLPNKPWAGRVPFVKKKQTVDNLFQIILFLPHHGHKVRLIYIV